MVGQGRRSRLNVKNSVLTSLLPCFRVKGRVKVKGQCQGHGQRSRSNFWRAAVDIRGSALPSAASAIGVTASLRCLSVCL